MSEETQDTQNDTSPQEHQKQEHPHNPTGDESPVNQPGQTPLEAVKARKSAMHQTREVEERRPDTNTEVPGMGIPSNRRKHPERQLG